MIKRAGYKKSEASRQQVLDAAVITFAERGFVRTSVGDIAATAGMSKGSVHYHFESKDDLVARVLELCMTRLHARVQAAWAEPGTPQDRVRRALRELWSTRVDGSPEMRVLTELTAQAVHEPALRTQLAATFGAVRRDMVAEILGSFERLGLRPKMPPAIVSRLLLAFLDGAGLHTIFDPPSATEQADMLRALEGIAFSLFEL